MLALYGLVSQVSQGRPCDGGEVAQAPMGSDKAPAAAAPLSTPQASAARSVGWGC